MHIYIHIHIHTHTHTHTHTYAYTNTHTHTHTHTHTYMHMYRAVLFESRARVSVTCRSWGCLGIPQRFEIIDRMQARFQSRESHAPYLFPDPTSASPTLPGPCPALASSTPATSRIAGAPHRRHLAHNIAAPVDVGENSLRGRPSLVGLLSGGIAYRYGSFTGHVGLFKRTWSDCCRCREVSGPTLHTLATIASSSE
jgi:hypothetical protein